jgi:hypothetical protein
MPSLQPSLQQKWIDVVAKKGLEEKGKNQHKVHLSKWLFRDAT